VGGGEDNLKGKMGSFHPITLRRFNDPADVHVGITV